MKQMNRNFVNCAISRDIKKKSSNNLKFYNWVYVGFLLKCLGVLCGKKKQNKQKPKIYTWSLVCVCSYHQFTQHFLAVSMELSSAWLKTPTHTHTPVVNLPMCFHFWLITSHSGPLLLLLLAPEKVRQLLYSFMILINLHGRNCTEKHGLKISLIFKKLESSIWPCGHAACYFVAEACLN